MEKRFSPLSGYLFVVIELVLLAATIMAGIRGMVIPGVVSGVVFLFLSFGFQIVNPNESAVLVLFGAYKGSIKENGFYWVNPFLSRRKI